VLTNNFRGLSLKSCGLRRSCLNLFKGTTAVISVGEISVLPSDKITKKLNSRNS
jgi:hypothetical protein